MLNSCGLELPIPRLIDSVCLDGQTYTIMTRISGKSLLLEIEEGNLTDEDLRAIVDEIYAVLRRLWTLEQPAGDVDKVVLSASGHGLPDPMTDYMELYGPYRSILDCYLHSTRHLQDKVPWTEDDLRAKEPELIKAVTSDPIVWVNIDLRPYNILVKDGRLSGIIDWERSGWLPRHWQLHALRNWIRTNPLQLRRVWDETKFPEDTEAAFQASFKLLRYPIT
ncbi:hypothetical protein EW146_g6257 [Bondarzewia mesenterica]|uniref:Aminoglycoside phosphotransferase domain-containing protein n=1 Tax=Bondarzewia mesenterica TaxID=1095465 RepID=A0A4S4LP84_9AGAM|nr:hypothetical protein EW146_g6257 [Bondarzewia mesenterica]